jgi:hypothetical protein
MVTIGGISSPPQANAGQESTILTSLLVDALFLHSSCRFQAKGGIELPFHEMGMAFKHSLSLQKIMISLKAPASPHWKSLN